MMRVISCLFFWILTMVSCESGSPAELRPSDYIRYIEAETNGLRVRQKASDFELQLQYRPIAYTIALEQRSNQIGTELFEKEKAERIDLQYYTFKIKNLNPQKPLLGSKQTSPEGFQKKVAYCAFDMQHDLKLVEGGDSLACRLFHFERTFSVSPEHTFLLGFERLSTKKEPSVFDKKLLFHDRMLGVGDVELKIASQALERIPKMKLK